MKIIVIFLCLSAISCTKVVKPDIEQPVSVPSVDATTSCPVVAPLSKGDFESVVFKLEEFATEYNICRHKHEELSKYIKTVK